MENGKFQLVTGDGLRLNVRRRFPSATPRGTVCLVHGLGEHGGRYEHVAGYLTAAGFAVMVIDLRGHGLSDGRRGHTPGYGALMNDLSLLVGEAIKRHPGIPCFLYGHSMGGNLVLNFALRRKPPIAGVIASAPLLRMAFEPSRLKMHLGKILRPLWPTMTTSNGVPPDDLSRDPEVVRAYREDPLVHDRVTLTFLDIREAGLWALDHAGELSIPALVMHGDADRITSHAASSAFADAAGAGCTLKIWNGFYHEIHNEPGKEQVLDLLAQWMDDSIREK